MTTSSSMRVSSIGTRDLPGELRTLCGSEQLPFAVATGFWAANDGGGGFFVWDIGGDKDDGGCVVVPLIGTPDANAIGPCWRRLFNGPVNPKWFGAKGDG